MNILFPEHPINSGLAYYRAYLPLLYLGQTDKRLHINMISNVHKDKMTEADWSVLMNGADIFFVSTPGGDDKSDIALDNIEQYNAERAKAGRAPLNIVIDVDDWLPDCNPFNPEYVSHGTVEKVVTLDNGDEIYDKEWINGKHYNIGPNKTVKYDIERNKKRIDRWLKYIKKAAAVITTNETLADKIREYNKNVYIIPNAVEPQYYEALPKVDREVRIGYVYSGSHFADFVDISPTLRDVINNTPFVRLVLMGPDVPLHGFELNKIERHPYRPINNGYHDAFNRLRLDIAICPLFNDSFNSYKSELKFVEYSMVKAAVLAPSIVYDRVIDEGKTGLIYMTPQEFTVKLKKLIADKELRKKLADEAYKYAQRYAIADIAPKYYETFKKIFKKGVAKNEKIVTGSI